MTLKEKLEQYNKECSQYGARLIAVSKTHSAGTILEAYNLGQKTFGENRVQELDEKHEQLPKDIEWHIIGHLQKNKVKYIASYVTLIHSVDNFELLQEINKQALKNGRVVDCLLQVYIAKEDTKFGLDKDELMDIITNPKLQELNNIKIVGLMGMATFTENQDTVRSEFRTLKYLFEEVKKLGTKSNLSLVELSMGMSGDYKIALEEGSTLVRIGSSIFGNR